MEHGPIDAGPSEEAAYDRGAPSPERSPRPHRSVSRHPSRQRNASPSGVSPSPSRGSTPSHDDRPLFTRIGATAADVQAGLSIDDDTHLKCDPQLADVEDGDARPHRMYRFVLYETTARYWITGADITNQYFRLLRIDRTSAPGQISLFEDETVYDRAQIEDVLATIDQGNKATNGLRMKFSFWGLLGFIRFTEAYYMLIITKRKQAAMIGGHYVYQIEGTDMVPLTTGSSSSFLRDRNPEEARFLGILNNLDLAKSFYFSYSFDITHTLQNNIMRQRQALNEGKTHATHDYNGMFVWNHHLLKPAVAALKHPYDWCLPIIHGFLDQAALDVFGRTVYVTIIGRRSRFFAGARFLKRGINDLGYVANDVETEQIVAEKLTTSFHGPGQRLYSTPNYTSYVHHRGSIPLYWTQDNSGVTPKPDININLHDPFYGPAALHFDNLFERYGCPIYVLNLVKSREKTARESKLLQGFQECLDYLNQSLPADKKIVYKAFDMARAAKLQQGNVIEELEAIAQDILHHTGLFQNGSAVHGTVQVQNGIARTNCIDCLDRTNAAQFVIGKHAFALQLQALGVIDKETLEYDTDAINLFTAMFHDHGDNIAMQYGGSHLVNTMATYRKTAQWQSSSRDMMESFKRYYHNSFLDSQRQEAYNLFLGNYIWAQGQPMLWDLTTDYYLHHSDPRAWLERHRRDYISWYTPAFLERRVMPPTLVRRAADPFLPTAGHIDEYDDYWRECYRPTLLSSLQKVFAYRIYTSQQYMLERVHPDHKHDFSPFVRRIASQKQGLESPPKKPARKGVTIVDPSDDPSPVLHHSPPRPATPATTTPETHSILRETRYPPPPTRPSASLSTTPSHSVPPLSTLSTLHTHSLNPSVSPAESREYTRYITHAQTLPLILSSSSSSHDADYTAYLARAHPDPPPALTPVDRQCYSEFVAERADFLDVTPADGAKKRYRAYAQWLRGRGLVRAREGDGGWGV
ncbi:hypothetical protein MRB53_040779 [Persea americana]|nr:hypothetical protein MRB53_040779 [Persea americana]